MGPTYKEYIFHYRMEWGEEVKLVLIRTLEKLPPSNATRKDGTWETYKTYPVPGIIEWSRIRKIEQEGITFGSGETKPGNYNKRYFPHIHDQQGNYKCFG